MSRPDPIEYAERLYAAIRGANFSTLSFLAFGNAVKDGVELRRMPRIAAEPFMRVVGEMVDLEDEIADQAIIDADVDRFRSGEVATSEPLATPASLSAEQLPAAETETPEHSTATQSAAPTTRAPRG
jgi:hypothetical protein